MSMLDSCNVIVKHWHGRLGCPKSKDGYHWAYYVFLNDDDKAYWCKEHFDEKNQCWWRHGDFMSIRCSKCGAYSPLRASQYYLGGLEEGDKACPARKIRNYRPDDELPESIRRYKEHGWTYYFFVETLSDSLDGQETFRLKGLPDG